jgi:hypothetical protein
MLVAVPRFSSPKEGLFPPGLLTRSISAREAPLLRELGIVEGKRRTAMEENDNALPIL